MERDLEYAGFWVRAAATVVDSVLLTVITGPMMLAAYGVGGVGPSGEMAPVVNALVSWILPAIIILAFWFWKSSTPGKMLFAAVIVDATSGERPSELQFVIRYFSYIVSTLPLGLGFFWVVWDPRKQGWHDKIAGTVVVRPHKRGRPASFGSARPAGS